MRLTLLFMLFFCVFGFLNAEENKPNEICSITPEALNSGPERNAAGIYPNDEVVLSGNGTFKIYDSTNKNISELINSCPLQSCGRNAFLHGFSFFGINNPLMMCEEHRCVNPETIKCRKTIETNACSGMNEWVAGFIPHENETHEWLEVECCHSIEQTNPSLFVKTISRTRRYRHDIVVDENNGKLIAMDYIKTIIKVNGFYWSDIKYTASIYRMKCSSSFNATKTNVSKIIVVDSTELSLPDADGIITCNKTSNLHYLSIDRWEFVGPA